MVKVQENATLDTMPKGHKDAIIKSLFRLTTLIVNSEELPTKGFVTSDEQKKDIACAACNVLTLLELLPCTFGFKDAKDFFNLCNDDGNDANDDNAAKGSGDGIKE